MLKNNFIPQVNPAAIEHQISCMHSAIDQASCLCNTHLQDSCEGDAAETDLTKIIHACCDMISPLLNEHIKMSIDLQHNVPVVPCEPLQLNRIILNLMKNSMESMSQRGGKLIISTGQAWIQNKQITSAICDGHRNPGIYAYVEIKDQGCGMDSQAFIQNGGTIASNRGSRHGYGLRSVIRLVNSVHGLLQVSSQIGKGTTMRVLLPRKPEDMHFMPEHAPGASVDHQVTKMIYSISNQARKQGSIATQTNDQGSHHA